MNKTLIRQLNRLNRQFYQQVSTSFSDSRSYYWQGWNKLVPYIQELADHHHHQVTILDIGCGNGRFGSFLAEQLTVAKIKYIGIDNSSALLEIAQAQTLTKNIKTKFIKIDLVESLLKQSLTAELKKLKPHFVTALGVLHHVPSHELRQNFISQLANSLTSPGYLAFTTWNFLDTKRFKKKIINPELVNLNPTILEQHDVILDWKRGETAYRYCHYTNQKELETLTSGSNLELSSQFRADGKSSRLNTYTILKK